MRAILIELRNAARADTPPDANGYDRIHRITVLLNRILSIANDIAGDHAVAYKNPEGKHITKREALRIALAALYRLENE